MSNAINAGVELPEEKTIASRNSDEIYRAIIGSKNQDGYLRQFARFDREGRISVSWHWPAFVVTFGWLIYRKMWGFAVIYVFLRYAAPIAIEKAVGVAGETGDVILGSALSVLYVALFLMPPMYANALYYFHCKMKISNTIESRDEIQAQVTALSKKGGTSTVALILGTLYTLAAIVHSGVLISSVCACAPFP